MPTRLAPSVGGHQAPLISGSCVVLHRSTYVRPYIGVITGSFPYKIHRKPNCMGFRAHRIRLQTTAGSSPKV